MNHKNLTAANAHISGNRRHDRRITNATEVKLTNLDCQSFQERERKCGFMLAHIQCRNLRIGSGVHSAAGPEAADVNHDPKCARPVYKPYAYYTSA